MLIPFHKYQGTGNDFIIIDNRKKIFDEGNIGLIKRICDRKFGIGADGLMLLQEKTGFDFEMIYFNSDGSKSLCGNGSRCIMAFARSVGMVKTKATFLTTDGGHDAEFRDGLISVEMHDVSSIERTGEAFFLDTGSPHYVMFARDLDKIDVLSEGKRIRNLPAYAKAGTNVNFVEVITERSQKRIRVRTYERGVENETLSCGTGVTACALVAHLEGNATADDHCIVKTKGGELTVRFKKQGPGYSGIRLAGPAKFVFKGEIDTDE